MFFLICRFRATYFFGEKVLTLAFIVKGLLEVAMSFLIAQGVLWLLLLFIAKGNHENNVVYSLFDIINRPLKKAGKALAPPFIKGVYINYYSFIVLLYLWIFVTFLVLPELCLKSGLSLSSCKFK